MKYGSSDHSGLPETFQLGLEWRGYKEVTTSMNHLNPKDTLIWQAMFKPVFFYFL